MKQTLYLLLLYAGIAQTTHAQTWQWGKRGGSQFDNSVNPAPYEIVLDMTTDNNGNVYTLANVETGTPADVDGHTLTAYGYRDMVLTKFSCNGTFAWAKVIGGMDDESYRGYLGTDTLGHLYVSGLINPQAVPGREFHFSTDSTLAITNEKMLFLMQYDTAGNFHWLRQPNPDTATFIGNFRSLPHDMHVMPGGDVYWMVTLTPGLVSGGGGWVVPSLKNYILRYNAQGAMTAHIPIQMDLTNAWCYEHRLHFTRTANRFIVAGGQVLLPGAALEIGGQPFNNSMFVAAFDTSGQFLWKRGDTSTVYSNNFLSSRILTDATGNIYCSGIINNNNVFAGYAHRNTMNPTTQVSADPFVFKMDSSGNIVWLRAGSGLSVNYENELSFKSKNEIWMTGTYTSAHWDSTHRLQGTANQGNRFYVLRFNTKQGALLSMDSLADLTGTIDAAPCNASDRKGNIYIGGQFSTSRRFGNQTISVLGGTTDFFIGKLGFGCNCITPVSNFTSSISIRTATLTYNGGTTNADSVKWTFGDGQSVTRTGSNMITGFTHNYAANGTYTICATVYGACGNDQQCQTIVLNTNGIASTPNVAAIRVYPNPADDYILIDGARDQTLTIVDLVGREMMRTACTGDHQRLSLAGLPASIYLLVLTDKGGSRQVFRVNKQ